MTFKIGDKVKVNDRYNGSASLDVVYKIVAINGSLYDIALYEGAFTYPCYESELELCDDEYYVEYTGSQDEKLCTCDSYNLLHYGCQCGSFKKTETNDEDQKIIDFFFPRSKK